MTWKIGNGKCTGSVRYTRFPRPGAPRRDRFRFAPQVDALEQRHLTGNLLSLGSALGSAGSSAIELATTARAQDDQLRSIHYDYPSLQLSAADVDAAPPASRDGRSLAGDADERLRHDDAAVALNNLGSALDELPIGQAGQVIDHLLDRDLGLDDLHGQRASVRQQMTEGNTSIQTPSAAATSVDAPPGAVQGVPHLTGPGMGSGGRSGEQANVLQEEATASALAAENVQSVSPNDDGGGGPLVHQMKIIKQSKAPALNDINIQPLTAVHPGAGFFVWEQERAFVDTHLPAIGSQDLTRRVNGTAATQPYAPAGVKYGPPKATTTIPSIFVTTAHAVATVVSPTSWSSGTSEASIRVNAGIGQGGRIDDTTASWGIFDPLTIEDVSPGEQFLVSYTPNWNAEFADPNSFSYGGEANFFGQIGTDISGGELVSWNIRYAYNPPYDPWGSVNTVEFFFHPSLGIDDGQFDQTVRSGISFSNGVYTYSGPSVQFVYTTPPDFQGGAVTFRDMIGVEIDAGYTGR